MVTLWNTADHYIFAMSFLLSTYLISILTGSIARSATRRYLIYSEADFEVFRPAGATHCTNWGEIWHGGADWG